MAAPQVILSGFADEAANHKTAVEQFAAFAAMGLQYYSVRFIDVGSGVKNVMQLTRQEVRRVLKLQEEYGLKVATLGSPIGKVKLRDVEDGTANRYVPFAKYLKTEVKKACELACTFGTRLIRGFSFYHPRGTDPEDHLDQAVEQLAQIAELCQQYGLVFGLEVEANLVGQNGYLMAELYRRVKMPNLRLIFDGANLSCQGYTPDEIYDQYLAMCPGLGWLHIKDYRHPGRIQRLEHVDEEALKHFVPADRGDTGHERILRHFATQVPKLQRLLKKYEAPGVVLDLEPHVKGGGQFGGFSGPDGMGVALRCLCRLLDYVGIGYHLRDFDDVRQARGF